MTTISPEQLQLAAERLEQLQAELGQISTWLSMADHDQAAILLESAWRDLSAAENLLRRRLRTRPSGWLNGQSYAQYGPQRPR